MPEPEQFGPQTYPAFSQKGLLDYISEGWEAYKDRGNPWFSENHPASIAARNIDWNNPANQSNDPYIMEQLSIIANSIGGGSNVPGALFGGGLLGGIIKKVPIKKGAKVKLKEGESIFAESKNPFDDANFILTRNPSKGQNWKEGDSRIRFEKGEIIPDAIDMSKAPKDAIKPEGSYRITQIGGMEGSNPWPTGHVAYKTLPAAWKKLQEHGKKFQHLTLDNPPLAPFILKGSRTFKDPTNLLDFRKLETDFPNVSQVRGDIFRPMKVHSEADDILKIFKSKKQQKQLVQWFEDGVKQGGLAWYNTNPLRKFAIEEFGEKVGLELYHRFLRYNAALSPNTKVPSNLKQASYWNTLDEAGLPIGDLIATRSVPPIPEGYSRMGLASVGNLLGSAQANTLGPLFNAAGKNIKMAGGVPKYAEGLLTRFPVGASKVNAFYENLTGNLMPATLDAGAMRAIAGKVGGVGVKAKELRTSASKEIYGQVEDAFTKFANRMGVAPAKAQASIWSGSSKYTGVGGKSPGMPEGASWMEMLMHRVNKTATETGKSPKQVLTDLLRGNQVLKSMIAPLLTTGAVGGLLGEMEGVQ